MARAPRWRINPLCRLRWRHWPEGHLLFNEADAQTHYLNDIGVGALEILQETPLDAEALSRRLAAACALEWDAELQSYVDTLVAHMDELGLIEPVYG